MTTKLTHTDLHTRLSRLEGELASANRQHRRWKVGTLALAALTPGLLLLAAADITRLDVVRAQRLEIIDGDGRIVMAAAAGTHGGRLDFWSAQGANLLRLAANQQGGDLALWNTNGVNVAGAWATESGGTVAAWTAEGQRGATLGADADGGHLAIGTSQNAVACRIAANEQIITLADSEHPRTTTMAAGSTTWSHGNLAVQTSTETPESVGLSVVDGTHWANLSATQAIVANAQLDGHAGQLRLTEHISLASDEQGVVLQSADTALHLGQGRLAASVHDQPWLTSDLTDGHARCEVIAGDASTKLSAGTVSGLHAEGQDAEIALHGVGTESVTLASGASAPVMMTEHGGIRLLASSGAGQVVLGSGESGQVRLLGGTDGQRPSIDVLAPGGHRAASMSTSAHGQGLFAITDTTGQVAASLRGMHDGNGQMLTRTAQGWVVAGAATDGSPEIAIVSGGRTLAALAAATRGGALNLMNADGTPVVLAGITTDGPGGAAAFQNGQGQTVVAAGSTGQGTGSVYVAPATAP